MSFQLAEALSWAVAGELMLTTPGPWAPLYPDTMSNYDNLWLWNEEGHQFGIMNRLRGSLPDGRNIWELARHDPRYAADAIRGRDRIKIESGSEPHADLAFRVAHWLLDGMPLQVSSDKPAPRTMFCLGNLTEGLDTYWNELLPETWHETNPRWLNALISREKVIGLLNFKSAEYHRIAAPGLGASMQREDGRPGCPLGYRLHVKTRSGEEWDVFSPVFMHIRRRRNYMEEGWKVELEPLFNLTTEAAEIDSLPVDFKHPTMED